MARPSERRVVCTLRRGRGEALSEVELTGLEDADDEVIVGLCRRKNVQGVPCLCVQNGDVGGVGPVKEVGRQGK